MADKKITNLIINKLTKSRYDALKQAGQISADELYSLTDLTDILDELINKENTGANTSLSNLNTTGETKIKNLSKSVCADTSLSNISDAGVNKIKSYGLDISYNESSEVLIISKP